jgi:hypothetical protein
MSIDRNFGRTLSGATDIAIDNLRLGNNINSIRINGNAGLPNQVIGKNGTTGKLNGILLKLHQFQMVQLLVINLLLILLFLLLEI